MLKKYKNRLLSTIRESKFDPRLFGGYEITPDVSTTKTSQFVIHLKASPLKFKLVDMPGTYHQFVFIAVRHTPEYKEEPSRGAGTFDWAEGAFKEWLQRDVREYIEENTLPDLWSQIESLPRLSLEAPTSEQDYLLFSEQERLQIRNGIIGFERAVIEQFDPPPEQLAYIQQQLKYLSNSVDRLNRFDWRGLALSVVIGIAINLTVDTEDGRLLFQLFDQTMQAAMVGKSGVHLPGFSTRRVSPPSLSNWT